MTETVTFATATTPAAGNDYTHAMHVIVPVEQVMRALTDEEVISRWWTSVTLATRHGEEVRLFMGEPEPLVVIIEHRPGSSEVTWTVTACAFLPDWVGTKPSFSVLANDDGSCDISFRHAGLRPSLECYDQCRAGWNHFMPSLHRFLQVGEGLPNQPRLTSA